MDRQTKKVVDAALQLPYADRSALLNRLLYVLDRGPEIEVLDATLALPEGGRWQVVDALFGAIDEAEEVRLDREWSEQIQHRIDDIESGRAERVSWPDVVRIARERARAES